MPKIGPRALAGMQQQVKTASADFSKEVRAGLLKRGIKFVGTTWLPDEKGNYANGMRGYLLDDNGKGLVRDYGGVLRLAGF
jgi:hypothetical protein